MRSGTTWGLPTTPWFCGARPSEPTPTSSVVITVRNEVVTSRIYFGTTIPVSAEAAPGYPDIPGLFAIVAEAMAGDPFLLSHQLR